MDDIIALSGKAAWPFLFALEAIRTGHRRLRFSGLNRGVRSADVRAGTEAAISACPTDVRFTPNSDRESGFPKKFMSALPPKADMCAATRDVCYGPKADISRLFDHRVGPGEQRRWQLSYATSIVDENQTNGFVFSRCVFVRRRRRPWQKATQLLQA